MTPRTTPRSRTPDYFGLASMYQARGAKIKTLQRRVRRLENRLAQSRLDAMYWHGVATRKESK